MALRRDGRAVELRPKAFDVLRVLVSQAGRVVSKDDLVATVWPDVFVNDDALAQCVRDVRRALGSEGAALLRTVPRRGYIFDGEVAEETGGPEVPETRPRTGWLAPAAVSAVLAVLFWTLALERPLPSEADARLVVAVLPFEALGAGDDQDWLGEGVAEDVITELSRFRDIAVIARQSSFDRAAVAGGAAAFGQSLGADYVLQGSLRRQADRLRLAVQLVDTATGTARWAERYDQPAEALPWIDDAVVAEIAAHLALRVRDAAAAVVADRPATRLDAYELTLLARHAYYRFTRETAYEALQHAEQATRRDPDLAAAWEILSRVLVQFYVQPYDDRRGDPATLARATEAAQRAVELDPLSSGAMATLGSARIWAGDHDGGLADLRRAVAVNPNDAAAWRILADALSRAGAQKQSLEAWQRGAQLDPKVAPLNLALMARSHMLLGEVDRARALIDDCLDRLPDMLPCQIFRALTAVEAGDEALAAATAARITELAPRFTVSGWLDIVRLAEGPTRDRLEALALKAGLPP